MIQPNYSAYLFCYWLLNITTKRLSGPQRVIVQEISDAAINIDSVSLQTWNNFNEFTAWRYPFYLVYLDLQTTGTYLLDIWPTAKIAYSFRLLNSSYAGYCVRVRRSSDNAEQSIPFTDGVLDQTLLLAFCAGSSGYVRTLYDQSGNNNDLIQATAASQPRLVNAGVVTLDNALPAMFFDGVNDFLDLTTAVSVALPTSTFFVNNRGANGVTGPTFSLFPVVVTKNAVNMHYSDNHVYSFQTPKSGITGAFNSAIQACLFSILTTTFSTVYLNLVSKASAIANDTGDGTINTFGSYNGPKQYGNGYVQEIVLWQSDQSAQLAEIVQSVKDFYSIT